MAGLPAPVLAGQVRRTTLLLAASLTLSWTVTQLQSSLTSVTLAELASPAVAGIGSTVYLGSSALASVLVGRLMDRRGRRIGLALGFVIGIAAAALASLGTATANLPVFLAGIACVGAAAGSIGLARVAAADLHAAETRGRGVSVVLMGSAVGALVAPIVFGPFLSGVHDDLAMMATPWLVAIGIYVLGLGAVAAIRIEPMELGRRLGVAGPSAADVELVGSPGMEAGANDGAAGPGRPIRIILGAPAVRVTIATVVIAQAVMAMAMAVVGLVLVGHGHDLASVSLTYSAHFLGMYGLVLLVGPLIDRIGHRRSLVLGVIVEVAGAVGLLAGNGPATLVPAIFLVGLGWNVAFVAATTMLADVTDASERARAIGLADALATGAAALGSVVATGLLALAGLAPLVALLVIVGLGPIPLVTLEWRRAGAAAGRSAA